MDKYYVIQKADKTDTVSIDRLKPAYLECVPLSVVPPTSSATSSPDPPVSVPSTQPPHTTTPPTHPDSPTPPRTSSRSDVNLPEQQVSVTDFSSGFHPEHSLYDNRFWRELHFSFNCRRREKFNQ
ncbi:hypothetical protein SprV_0501866600 [Sparganum proliferum]